MSWVPGAPEPLSPLVVACAFCHAPIGKACVGSLPCLTRENDANNVAWAAHRAKHQRDQEKP